MDLDGNPVIPNNVSVSGTSANAQNVALNVYKEDFKEHNLIWT